MLSLLQPGTVSAGLPGIVRPKGNETQRMMVRSRSAVSRLSRPTGSLRWGAKLCDGA
jgi:hypothetical protein